MLEIEGKHDSHLGSLIFLFIFGCLLGLVKGVIKFETCLEDVSV